MRINHSDLVFEYISKREGQHLSNAAIAEDLNISRAVVSRVMYYGVKKCKPLFRVSRGVWVFNPGEEVKTEKPKLIQLMDMFEENPTLSASEISTKLDVPHKKVSDMIKRLKKELNAEIEIQSQYTFKG